MKHYKLYIFDWDGTLMDSVSKIVDSMQAAAEQTELVIPTTIAVKNIIGASLTEAAKILFPGICEMNTERLIKHYKQQYLSLNTTPSPLFGHAKQLLQALNQQDKLLAVATGKGRQGLERVLAESDTKHLFHITRSSDDALSKPHADMLEQILNELNITPNEALMIGDSSYDLQMAQNANIDSIGITHGVACGDTLAKHQPKAIVHSIEELAELISH